VYISDLRRALGADVIETRRGGYRLCVDEEQVDACLFEQMVGRVNGGPPEQALAELLEALDLWRGPALGGAAESSAVRAAATRLEEERLAALEQRFAAELELGHHHQILGELASLVCAMPLQESLRRQLMLALYRSGRQAEALGVYRDGHAQLRELGLEPGGELRDLERAILRQDPILAGAAARSGRPVSSASCLDDQTLDEIVAFAESWATDLRNFDPAAFDAIAERAEQLVSAFERAIATGAKEAAVRLIAATWFYWIIRGAQQQADVWAQAILALPEKLTPTDPKRLELAYKIARVLYSWRYAFFEYIELTIANGEADVVPVRGAIEGTDAVWTMAFLSMVKGAEVKLKQLSGLLLAAFGIWIATR